MRSLTLITRFTRSSARRTLFSTSACRFNTAPRGKSRLPSDPARTVEIIGRSSPDDFPVRSFLRNRDYVTRRGVLRTRSPNGARHAARVLKNRLIGAAVAQEPRAQIADTRRRYILISNQLRPYFAAFYERSPATGLSPRRKRRPKEPSFADESVCLVVSSRALSDTLPAALTVSQDRPMSDYVSPEKDGIFCVALCRNAGLVSIRNTPPWP